MTDFLETQRPCSITYGQVGCTRERAADGFDVDEYRVRLGEGDAVFAAAKDAIAGWKMFPNWVDVIHDDGPPQRDQTVAILIHVFGLWWLSAARLVYVDDAEHQFGFAYGTLPAHFECGEERFAVERDEQDVVWYDLCAVSRPHYWWMRLGYPCVRRLQRQFAADSQRAMVDAVS